MALEILFTYPTLTLIPLCPDIDVDFWCCFDSVNQEIKEITSNDEDQHILRMRGYHFVNEKELFGVLDGVALPLVQ